MGGWVVRFFGERCNEVRVEVVSSQHNTMHTKRNSARGQMVLWHKKKGWCVGKRWGCLKAF